MAYENDDKLNEWVDDYYKSIIKTSSIKGTKVTYYQALRGYFRHSIILTDIILHEFGFVDYKIWYWILTEIKSGHNPAESGGIRLRYSKVSNLCKRTSFFKTKSKLLKLKLLLKTPFKDYYLINPKYIIKMYNPNDDVIEPESKNS